MFEVKKALPVWGATMKNKWNQFAGFYTKLEKPGEVTFRIAARSYYRLYVDGNMLASGPARTAEHYCRVDEIRTELKGQADIAVEVVALSKPEKYCNDCTMEDGLFLCEILDADGEVLAATGGEEWKYRELLYRRSLVETMSHSRGILEYYDLTPMSFDWMRGKSEWEPWALVEEKIGWLPRNAKYPTYRPLDMQAMTGIYDEVVDKEAFENPPLSLAKLFNPTYFSVIPEENYFVDQIRAEKSVPFSGKMKRLSPTEYEITPGVQPTGCVWEREFSDVGFIDFTISVEKECTLDVLNTDHRGLYGAIRGNSYCSRYHLAPGSYHLTTFEQKLTRYVKFVLRTEGKVTVTRPRLLEDTYPDGRENSFSCSDGELNRIYEAARRTLRLCTLDIYMDCPQRERGGWLCDSQFNGPASWLMFGDLTVEHDFLENFLLTDPDEKWKSFFPEVYPGVHKSPEEVGITNWSFWLVTELYDYYQRSGDREFIDKYACRIERFIEGMLTLRGESGLLENLPNAFVDWSISNKEFNLQPINVPNNCLAVCLLERAAEMYRKPEWAKTAQEMRTVIEGLTGSGALFGADGDAAVLENGRFHRTGVKTEAGMALELWSGFHLENKVYIQQFVNALGPCPEYRPNPNVGRTNMFIGMMIRFEVLARLGRSEQLIRELKDVYLQELRDGSGTLFENVHALSGCHAFNGEAGALIVNQVLGLGQPLQLTKTVTICPHPARLRWAVGTAETEDGTIFMDWSSEPDEHRLVVRLQLPKGWKYEFQRPFELEGWEIKIEVSSLAA